MSNKVYGFCSAGCKYEVVSKDDIPYKIVCLTQAEYDDLVITGKREPNTIYEITDDNTIDDIKELLKTLNAKKLYRHHVSLGFGTPLLRVNFTVYNYSSEKFTTETIGNYFDKTMPISVTGFYYENDTTCYPVILVRKDYSDKGYYITYVKANATGSELRSNIITTEDDVEEVI